MEKEYKKERKSFDRGSRGGDDDGGDKFFRKRRARPAVDAVFDYKDIETLKSYLGDDGKIVPGRVSKMNRQQQNQLTVAIKRARQLALLPTSGKHF